jgi:hypothetical protein
LDEWTHLKLEIRDDRLWVFLDGSEKPDFEVARILHDGQGTLGVCGAGVFFANFRYVQAP